MTAEIGIKDECYADVFSLTNFMTWNVIYVNDAVVSEHRRHTFGR